MSGVRNVTVAADEAELRLDRWFRQHFPQVTQGRLQKLLRTGQVRVDGHRAKAADRLTAGQTIRVPPLPAQPPPARPAAASADETAALRARVLYMDDMVVAIDKPAGLAVQGGTKLERHLDAMLDALRFDAAERPRLVHRLDKETAGVLLLARGRSAARALADAFRRKDARKNYWAIVVGVPTPEKGVIRLALRKQAGAGGERVVADETVGQRAVTEYAVVATAGKRAAWLALSPVTGRTHQLRAHCAALGTPILGDGKYGGKAAFIGGEFDRKLHLFAREIDIPHPAGARRLHVTAPPPAHMRRTFDLLGFDMRAAAGREPLVG